ncbi:MAG: TonB-dependent receptor, partial [Leadbetterella sp.]
MKKTLFTICLLFILKTTFSQGYIIKGILQDTANTPLGLCTVLLLKPTDSTLVTFTRADDKGFFQFKNIKKQDYLIKITYSGLIPYQTLVKYIEENQVDLGVIRLKPILKELMEVVIKTARAPIEIRGDTIEYDARKFKVPPGSSVEDLLRRLPGFQIDADGNIKAQGERVQKVLVDGKSFFGNDPKVATKQLPAESINRIQVFDDKSEQSKLTGIEDGKRDKTVNLELKEEFKKGGFGKITAGIGTDERLMTKGNYNRFNQKNQFSIVGFGNNLNQTGLNRDDYQDFKGSQSYQWNDNADFGFENGSGFRMFNFEDDGDEESSMSIPQSWGEGDGFSKNLAGGVNYNYDTPKTKFSSSYFYNLSDQVFDIYSQTQTFLNSTSYFQNARNLSTNLFNNHRLSFRFEKSLDSLNTITINFNGRLSKRENSNDVYTDFINKTDETFRENQIRSTMDGNSNAQSGAFIFRHKFRKKGRNFALSGSLNRTDNNNNSLQASNIIENRINGEQFPLEGLDLRVNQLVFGIGKSLNLKSSILYTEPFTKKLFGEMFYNYSILSRDSERDVNDLNSSDGRRIESLSRYFDNRVLYNRLGAQLRFIHKGLNLSSGWAYTSMGLQ